MEQLFARIRRIKRWADFPDGLLQRLLAQSDFTPDRIGNGVILFQQNDFVTYWYFLLSGEVELYLPSNSTTGYFGQHLLHLSAGALFGELNLFHHCCSARVKRTAEFVRLSQNHFLALYQRYADVLQPCITVMEDVVNAQLDRTPSPSVYSEADHPRGSFVDRPTTSAHLNGGTTHQRRPAELEPEGQFDFENVRHELDNVHNQVSHGPAHRTNGDVREMGQATDWDTPVNVFELSNSLSMQTRIYEAALVLERAMHYRAPHLFRERRIRRGDRTEVFSNAASGAEMAAWLGNVSSQFVNNIAKQLSPLQIIGIWQTLLDHHLISHVTNEEQFRDKHVFYKWVIVDPFEDYFIARHERPNLHLFPQSPFVAVPDPSLLPPPGCEPPTDQDLQQAIFFLSTIGLDSIFKLILMKPPKERTPEELELVFEELIHVKALSHLSTMVKKELARVIRFEQHEHAGTVLFHQGDEGFSWYIVLKGSVDVSIAGKGVVCTLQEGDDFGKLALVNDAPRAATITLRDDNSQFLRVDKENFDRILRDVEENTVRLKEHGHDVLVLERIHAKAKQGEPLARNQCCYSVMAGLPEKMVEYVLETRIDAQMDTLVLDTFLEDFILTHIIFMPSNILCNYLKNYYAKRGELTDLTVSESVVETEDHLHKKITAKKRVVTFISIWEYVLGIHFFLDPVANSFVEEIYCCALEDACFLPNMELVVTEITRIRQAREKVMMILSRHPTCVLDCGIYNDESPAPNPVLSIDTCNQCIYFSDATMITTSIRLDKSGADVIRLIRGRIQFENKEDLFLVEVKSCGERVVFSPNEVSIPTMMSLNGRLYLVNKEDMDSLAPLPNQAGPSVVIQSVLDVFSSSDLAAQLALFHTQLFHATDEIELVFQVVGRNKFPGRSPSNLDILLRRFNEVQFWTTTEILMSVTPAKRLGNLKKLIKTAVHAKQNKDLMSLFAITLGLSNVAVSRLLQLWDKLPGKLKRQFAEFEALLDPSRNHRAYRLMASKMEPPMVPFVPLLLKDLTFMHEGNKTYFGSLVNFEKMHMIANVLRNFRSCKSNGNVLPDYSKKPVNHLIRNFRVIDNQKRLMEISYQIEPPTRNVRQISVNKN